MMKYIPVVFAALAATATTASAESTNGNSRNLASLAKKWNITDPTFDYESLSFDLDYGISDFIKEGMAINSVWDADCKEGNVAVSGDVLKVTQSTLAADQGTGDGNQVLQLTVEVESEKITSDTNIYEETTVNGELFAVVNFCVRLSLNTPGTSAIEVNFLETLITLNVDLTDGFSIGTIAVTPKDKLVKTANQAYELEAYQCDSSFVELSEAAKAVTRNQGAIMRVCVRPDEIARPDGIFMRSIDSFTFTRETPNAEQKAVENKKAAGNGLTELFCGPGYEVCMFETILFAQFYRVSGTVTGTGIGSMQFGGSARRQLRAGDRTLQDDEPAASAEFDLDFETIATPDNGAASGASTFGSILAVAALAMGATAALF